ncbi:MAG: DUF4287 domain-containing protein [Candidatus Kapabacteria bacterium]|nr:DUF4287 domain-containing protein [Candidatus Kapabacteria bacterium]
MDQAEQTMVENILKNTGIPLEEWLKIVQKEQFQKHSDIINFLKAKHSFTYGFANFIAHKSKKSDAGSHENKDDLISKQYEGKEHFKSLYDLILKEILKFGDDIEVAPKISYVSLRRKKQFAMLQPKSKKQFEIGLNVKGFENEGVLQKITSNSSMCSHKIVIHSSEEVNEEVLNWIKTAYNTAG